MENEGVSEEEAERMMNNEEQQEKLGESEK